MSESGQQQSMPGSDSGKTGYGFHRYYGTVDVWAVAFGCIVGWGAFVMPGTTFLPVAGPIGTLIAMAISVAIMLVIGSNYSFLMIHRPGTGGVYSYTKEAFGRDHAFLCSWFLCLSYLTIVFLNATALFIVVRTMAGNMLQVGYHYNIAGEEIYLPEVAVSVGALALIGLLFIKAKAILQKLHTFLAIILLLGTVLIAVICIPHLSAEVFTHAFGIRGFHGAYAIFSIVLLAPWAFVGFDVISMETSHFKFRISKAKWIIVLSILFSGLVYTVMTFVSISAIPDGYASWADYLNQIGNISTVASVPSFFAARQIMGPAGLVIMGITALAAILTGMIGAYRATTRVLSTMAEDNILSDKFLNTSHSIVFIMGISIVISFLGRNALDWFVELTSFGAIVGFGYTSAAAWKMARTENNRRTLLTGIIGTVISCAFAVVQLIPRLTAMETMGASSFLVLSLWCLLGFLFYWRTVRNSALSQYSAISTSGAVLFTLLLYSSLMWIARRLSQAQGPEEIRQILMREGIILLIVIFIGLLGMLYIQNLVRRKHEVLERERIRAVESSLAKSQFLFNMSHDIRTPMNAIIGYANIARQENTSPVIGEYLSKIDTSSQHLLSLINDILEMSRIESGIMELEFAPEDLCRIIVEIRDLFSEQMKSKDLDFSIHTSQIRHRYVWCDRNNLNRVFLNIISNAYKFTPAGGTISASVWEISSPEEGMGSYEIRIRDSGIGMSREFSEKMFHAFERERTSTVSKTEGTGLGLAITKSIIDLMGGTIEVITSPGAGTEFIIRVNFRLASEEEVEAAKKKTPGAEPGQIDYSTVRLLVVEDNEINREIALMILSQEGFQLETAENGQEALDLVRASQAGYYDLVLMDIQMPVMDGYSATRAIRALEDPALASVPIVAMTANAFKEDEDAAREAGMQGHIAKPLDVHKMMTVISEVLTNHRKA
ncbi:MAG: amino acid permease [Parasporobacterium sp.]|nr:amino acid permease [Parasporobacterium sp.]MBQ9033029.1 amino acid permease [Parasporobacterium sp.]